MEKNSKNAIKSLNLWRAELLREREEKTWERKFTLLLSEVLLSPESYSQQAMSCWKLLCVVLEASYWLNKTNKACQEIAQNLFRLVCKKVEKMQRMRIKFIIFLGEQLKSVARKLERKKSLSIALWHFALARIRFVASHDRAENRFKSGRVKKVKSFRFEPTNWTHRLRELNICVRKLEVRVAHNLKYCSKIVHLVLICTASEPQDLRGVRERSPIL